MDHAGAFSTAAVWVMRTNFARTGRNAIAVAGPLPCPSATGELHVVPSMDTCARYPRGNVPTGGGACSASVPRYPGRQAHPPRAADCNVEVELNLGEASTFRPAQSGTTCPAAAAYRWSSPGNSSRRPRSACYDSR